MNLCTQCTSAFIVGVHPRFQPDPNGESVRPHRIYNTTFDPDVSTVSCHPSTSHTVRQPPFTSLTFPRRIGRVGMVGCVSLSLDREAMHTAHTTSISYSSLTEPNRSCSSWEIWKKSQRYDESSDVFCDKGLLTRGWDYSRGASMEEPVYPASGDPATHTGNSARRRCVELRVYRTGCWNSVQESQEFKWWRRPRKWFIIGVWSTCSPALNPSHLQP